MKLDCGLAPWKQCELDRAQRLKDADIAEQTWVRYFTLFPTRIGDNDCRWLEWVERKPSFYYTYMYNTRYDVDKIKEWDYRTIE